jgi:ribonuclease P protein component
VHVVPRADRPGQPARVGFVVAKSVGGAVVRNRTKRVLRAVMRARLGALPDGIDCVVRANPAAAGASSQALASDVDRLLPAAVRRLRAGAIPMVPR